MASSSSPIATLVAPPSFTGVSKFASGLQQVLSRTVSIASLPLQSLEAGLTDLNDRQSALQGLDTTFLSLQLSLNSLQSALSSSVLSSSVS
ncbi:MAG TPA: hypothetical protein VHB50_09315, partial [Bryobacteraceae bacterium]|nr:hypothetical protein [Bryobacteraceae bacterium]